MSRIDASNSMDHGSVDEDDDYGYGGRETRGKTIAAKGTIVKDGYLEKAGKVNAAFQKRWIILRGNGDLSYSKDEATAEKGENSGVIQVIGATLLSDMVIPGENDPTGQLRTRTFGVQPQNSDRVYAFRTTSSNEKNAWIHSLKSIDVPTIQPRPKKVDDDLCWLCRKGFGFMDGRKHCKACGHSFHDRCCNKYKASLPEYGIFEQVRVCEECYQKMPTTVASERQAKQQIAAAYNSPTPLVVEEDDEEWNTQARNGRGRSAVVAVSPRANGKISPPQPKAKEKQRGRSPMNLEDAPPPSNAQPQRGPVIPRGPMSQITPTSSYTDPSFNPVPLARPASRSILSAQSANHRPPARNRAITARAPPATNGTAAAAASPPSIAPQPTPAPAAATKPAQHTPVPQPIKAQHKKDVIESAANGAYTQLRDDDDRKTGTIPEEDEEDEDAATKKKGCCCF